VASSVTRLVPRLGSYASAVAAFRAACFRDCLAELHGVESHEAAALSARASLRLGDPEGAIRALKPAFGDFERAETAMLAAASHLRLGRSKEAFAALIEARTHAISAGDYALDAELAYYSALFTVGQGYAGDARDIVERGLDSLGEHRGRVESVITPSHAAARLHEMLVVLEAGEGRYGDAISHARAVVATLQAAPMQDVYLDGYAFMNLAILARDFDLRDSAEICRRVDLLRWSGDIATVHFTAVEAAGWCAALRGDLVTAFERFRVATDVSTTVPERIIVSLDRALLARESGFAAMAIEELRYAARLSRTFDWADAAGDHRRTLLDLAQISAPLDTAEARAAINRYSRVCRSTDVRFASRREARVQAEEDYTHGLVLRAEGRLDASAERLRAAFSTWQQIGYAWRAARAALELAELGAGEVFRVAVRRELRERPQSVFATRARLIA